MTFEKVSLPSNLRYPQTKPIRTDGNLIDGTVAYLKAFLVGNGYKVGSDGLATFATNGLDWLSASLTGWNRHLKGALVKFLEAEGYNPGKSWGTHAVKALQTFLNAHGASLTVNGEMGISASVGSNWQKSATTKALQVFLIDWVAPAADAPTLELDANPP